MVIRLVKGIYGLVQLIETWYCSAHTVNSAERGQENVILTLWRLQLPWQQMKCFFAVSLACLKNNRKFPFAMVGSHKSDWKNSENVHVF